MRSICGFVHDCMEFSPLHNSKSPLVLEMTISAYGSGHMENENIA